MLVSANPWLRYIGANVRRLRLSHGLTQEQLAERAAIEPRYVHSIEAARANPTVRTLVRIAAALEVLPATLFEPARFSKSSPGRPRTAPAKKTPRKRRA